MSAIGPERTCTCALHMAAFDPKRTFNCPFPVAGLGRYYALT